MFTKIELLSKADQLNKLSQDWLIVTRLNRIKLGWLIAHLDEVTVKAEKHPSKEPKTDYELNNWSLESIKNQLQLVKI